MRALVALLAPVRLNVLAAGDLAAVAPGLAPGPALVPAQSGVQAVAQAVAQADSPLRDAEP